MSDGETVVWRGMVGTKLEWIEFTVTPGQGGRLAVELRSEVPLVREGEGAEARLLGFAVYGVEVR